MTITRGKSKDERKRLSLEPEEKKPKLETEPEPATPMPLGRVTSLRSISGPMRTSESSWHDIPGLCRSSWSTSCRKEAEKQGDVPSRFRSLAQGSWISAQSSMVSALQDLATFSSLSPWRNPCRPGAQKTSLRPWQWHSHVQNRFLLDITSIAESIRPSLSRSPHQM